MDAQDNLGDEPGSRTQHEQRGLQVVEAVIDEFGFFQQAQSRRPEDGEEPLVDVVAVTLCPAHALARQPSKGRDALGRCLRVRRVDDLVALRVKAKGELPVFRETAAPTQFPQETRPDHVGGARDHLHRAQDLLEGTLDHIAAGVLGAYRGRQPAFVLVQDVPLIALHGTDFVEGARPRISLAVEVVEQIPQDIREGHGVRIEDGDEFCSRVHIAQRITQRAAFESIPRVAVDDREAIDLLPGFEDLHRSVRGVVDEDDLVVGVVQLGAGLEQATHDPLFVVGRDVNRDKGLVSERQPPGAIAVGMRFGGPAATCNPY